MEVLIQKNDDKKIKSRAACSTNYNYGNIGNDIKLYCQVDDDVLDKEVVKINVDSNGFSNHVQFVPKDNKNIYKNILLDYNKDDWEDEDNLYDVNGVNDDIDEDEHKNKNCSNINLVNYIIAIFLLLL